MIPGAVARRYRETQPFVEMVAQRAGELLARFCSEKGYPYVGRTKEAASLAEKVESGRFEKWSELDDLFACTIVIPTLKHETPVLEFLRERFVEVETRRRGSTAKSPDVFRFEATRFIGKLRPPPGIAPTEPVYATPFEVQIRTAFEHAWSAATHALVYKSGRVDWKRMRMAAQLKAAVEQLDTLVLAFEASVELITEHDWPDVNARAAIAQRFQQWLDLGVLPSELEPKDWSRFAENMFSLVRSAHRGGRQKLPSAVTAALDIIGGELQKMNRKLVPKSLSLFQLCLGILVESGWLNLPLQDFCAPVTPELLELYPKTKEIEARFQFES